MIDIASYSKSYQVYQLSVVWYSDKMSTFNGVWNSQSGRSTHLIVIKWKHFPRYWLFVRGIQRSPVSSPDKGQWRGALVFYSIFVWINGSVNNREGLFALPSAYAHGNYILLIDEDCWIHLIFFCQNTFSKSADKTWTCIYVEPDSIWGQTFCYMLQYSFLLLKLWIGLSLCKQIDISLVYMALMGLSCYRRWFEKLSKLALRTGIIVSIFNIFIVEISIVTPYY